MDMNTRVLELEKDTKTKSLVIDTDVHESFGSLKDLVPYLKEPWKRLLEGGNWKGFSTDFLYWYNPTDWTSQSVSSYKRTQTELLDEYDIRYAILTGYFYPSMLKTQREFAAALASAYNDFMIENWLEKDDRFFGSIQIAPQDPQSAALEIDRLASHPRMIQVMLPIDFKAYGDPYYHPIFEAAQRNNLKVAFHHTTIAYSGLGIGNYSIERHMNLPQLTMAMLTSLICNGIFDKFPKLGFIFLEGGFTWAPHLIWRADREYKSLRAEVPWVKNLPSQYIRERVRLAIQPTEDISAQEWMKVIELMGSDEMLCFATDYPHYDFDAPTRALPAGLPEDIKKKILYQNAGKFYNFMNKKE
ncbi:amidohydrolase family protein [Effusibacillus dendaii]|uniref:Amidohydrolase n=1 Tax=Effusibacillus dendaii TaxID=2743772 RepID=A0A7I8DCE4_9BACL|nr:amidohydrolase family protein [Effusibacillus dendaii]BCJ87697.1 amidohydrolase [Effusibacillus dendaii]